MVCQELDLERAPIELCARQRAHAFAQRSPSDCQRVDRADRPSAWAPRAPRAHVGDQEALEAPRHMPAVLDRPHPLLIQAASPGQEGGVPGGRGHHGLAALELAVAASTAAAVCCRLCGSEPITIMCLGPSLDATGGRTTGRQTSVGHAGQAARSTARLATVSRTTRSVGRHRPATRTLTLRRG